MMNSVNNKLKILQFCNKPPFPPKDGGAIGMHNVSQGFLDFGHKLKILSVNSDKHQIDISTLPEEYLQQTSFEAENIDLNIKPLNAFGNLIFSKRSYNITRFYNKALANKLKEVILKEDFDIIQMESIFLKDYIPIIRKYSKAKLVLRAPNVEFMIWQRLAQIEKNPIKRFYLNILSKRLKKEELTAIKQFDAIYTVTENDLLLMKSLGVNCPIEYIPTGIDVTKNISLDGLEVEYPSLFHLGALDWFPNQEAVKWLLNKVWPKLRSQYPQLKFYIAGRRPPQWLLELNIDGVEVVGEVEDAAEFFKSKAIMPVPLFSGSGMRVKIIEAMMLQKAVVTTSIGIEGIMHNDGIDVLIANSADEFVNSIKKLIDDEGLYKNLCANAQKNMQLNYSNDVLTKKLIGFFERL